MTALMLAAQRGHTSIVKMLIRAGANIDITTSYQGSTALMLACKRGHIDTTIALISAGSELMLRDSRGRTAKDSALRKGIGMRDLTGLMTPEIQIALMQQNVMVERKYILIGLWKLLQQNRAFVKTDFGAANKHNTECVDNTNKFQQALVQTMLLPLPLVDLIASYLPKPPLWEQRLEMLSKRCHINPDATICCSLDLIDEALEEGGFVEACDLCGLTPPSNFRSWVSSY